MKFTKALLKILLMPVCLVIILFSPNYAVGKNLVYAEYFIDTDPGQGNGTSVPACDGVFDEAEEEICLNNIPVGVLTDGRHTLFLRLKDSENKWGMRRLDFYVVSTSPYVSKTITGAEYYIDSNPGQGSGSSIPVADGFFDEPIELLLGQGIESSALTVGLHTLFVRVKDLYNVWSIPRKVDFNVLGSSPYKTLKAAEYFIDTDPGVGLGIPLVATDSAFDESVEGVFRDSINTSSDSVGPHLVYVRFKDNWSNSPNFNGWGPTKIDTLKICTSLYGDANSDGNVTVSDVVYLVAYLFKHGPPPCALNSGDPNRDCRITVADVVYLVAYLFKSGPPPKVGCVQ